MKLPYLPFALLTTLFAAGCGGPKPAGTAETPAASGPRVIEITANDTMKYNVAAITAKPGEDLQVVLTNIGSAPVDVMGHNWTLLKAGADANAFAQAASTHKDTGYMPPELKGEVLAHIDLLGPRKSGDATFKAPTAPGDYPYLCTFPAHYLAGMRGVLTVK